MRNRTARRAPHPAPILAPRRARSGAASPRNPFPDASLDAVSDAVVLLDADGCIRRFNLAARHLLHLDSAECLGRNFDHCVRLHASDDAAAQPLSITQALGRRWPLPDAAVLVRSDGSLLAIEGECAPLAEQGRSLLVLRDVSEQRRARRWLAFQATHDNLTTLFNRAEIERRVSAAIGAALAGRKAALLYIDIDQFKIINDTCGHHAGDEFLRQAGKALIALLQQNEALARLGGDEFVVLAEGDAAARPDALAARLIQAIQDIRFAWEQRVFRVSASIGIVEIGPQHRDWKQVLSLADSACYMAKEHGRARCWTAREDDERLRRRRLEMDWAARITSALEEDRFALYRQQITPLDSRSGKSHWEVLTRLREGSATVAKPEHFIPAAERYGLMPAIDRWVIGSVLRHLGALPASHPDRRGVIAINVSGTSLSDHDFVRFISASFDRFRVNPRQVCFEITETAAATDFDAALRFVAGVRALGCRVSLDDFGSGISSFAYLKAFSIDYLKIDGSFVRDMDRDPVNARFVESINHLGKSLGLATIAEYVETAPVVEHLRGLGVDYAQGNFLGRPQQWIA